MTKRNHYRALLLCGATLFFAGCNKQDNSKANYQSAINDYYKARPACIWQDTKKFPVQAATSDDAKTEGYDALTDAGLLTRTTAEKKVFIIASKQVTNYDLTDKGRSAWTADTQQPGFGNFCYGTRKVSSIDSAAPTSSQPGATTTVNYHTSLSGAPGWATAPETQTAFPQVRANVSGPMTGVATLTDTTSGWAVTSGPKSASSADGSIVQ